MPPLYLVEQGSVLQREGERLAVTKDGKPLLSVPVFKVDSVHVFGHVQVTTQAVELLLAHGVDLCYFTMNGRLKGRLVGPVSKNIFLRVKQFNRAQDPAFCLMVAGRIVAAKIWNARQVLMRYARNHPEIDLAEPIRRLRELVEQVRHAPSVNVIRGLEGTAAAIYFRALARTIRTNLAFHGRQKRPPRDPVNALLSLGYTLLTNEVMGRVTAHGFDPYLGFYHTLRYGRPSLALDLVEEFRHPVVDRFVLALVNRRMVSVGDFERRPEDGGIILKPSVLRQFLAAYEQYMRRPVLLRRRAADIPADKDISFRDMLDIQVRRFAHTIQEGTPYIPFTLEG